LASAKAGIGAQITDSRSRFAPSTRPCDLVIVDEAHRLNKKFLDWLATLKCPVVGLSATPWTKGLAKHYDALIIVTTTKQLIEEGFLSDLKVFAPHTPDLSKISTVAGEYNQHELGEACNKPELVGDVVTEWIKRGEDRPTLVFGVDCAHAEHLQQRFVEVGIVAEYMDGETLDYEREAIFARFRDGETKVITSVGVLTTGVDLPMASCIIDARPTKSEILHVQTIGRGLRTAPGKDNLIVLDHAGNTLRLGLVTDIVYDKLDDGEPRKGAGEKAERAEPLPRLCDECKAVVPRQQKVCPQCGHVIEANSTVNHRDGELVAYGSGEQAVWIATHADKIAFYAEVEGYRLDVLRKGKTLKPGWTSVQFKERFGHWAPFDWRGRIAPKPPSLKTRGWIKSRQIAWAKGRAARG
jgi:DNA repair protein RadD